MSNEKARMEISHYMTYREIAEILGLSHERVRQIEEVALRKLKHPSNMKKLREAMETMKEIGKNHNLTTEMGREII